MSVCPGTCCQWPPSSSWSGLRPALATSPRPCHAPAALLLPGWTTSEVTVASMAPETCLLTSTPPSPLPWLLPSVTQILVIPVWTGIWCSTGLWLGPWPCPFALWKLNKEMLEDLGLLKGVIQFSLVDPAQTSTPTKSFISPISTSNIREWGHV